MHDEDVETAGTGNGAEERGWLLPLGLAVGFLLWGLLIFYAVGVKWPPAWNFGAVPDVPGLSTYSSGGRNPLPTVTSPYLHEQAELSEQHVRSRPQPAAIGVARDREPQP